MPRNCASCLAACGVLIAACSPNAGVNSGLADAAAADAMLANGAIDAGDAGGGGATHDAAGQADSGSDSDLDAAVAIDCGVPVDAGNPLDAAQSSPDAAAVDHCQEDPVGKVSLPADDSGHTEAMEWWYWTGHLKTADGHWFGFEEVFFGTLVAGIPGRMVHVAVSDIGGGAFHYSAVKQIGALGAIPDAFQFSMPPQTAVGGNGHDTLHGEVDGWVLDLTADAIKPPVYQDAVGYTAYPFGGYTYYYSRERMAAQGTLKNGATTLPVTGTAWFDHQWGSLTNAVTLGWDWFAFQLDDDREMMIFIVRDSGKQVLVGGSYTDASCLTTSIDPADFQVASTGTWTSPRFPYCTYPAGWTVVVKGMSFTVTPALADQEVTSAIPIYWEGAAIVSDSGGTPIGRAYVELEGYCP